MTKLVKDYEIIKHIPHSSLGFPREYTDELLEQIYGEDYLIQNYKLTDLFIDQLFKDIKGIEIKARYSRLYCDVERYIDDDKEPMSKLGQGYIYTKNIFNGKDYNRQLINDTESITNYYYEHHKTLTEETKKILSKGKKVLILDLHSFNEELVAILEKSGPFPDICIGINDDYDSYILNKIIEIIKSKGYSYRINYPYEGAIIPNNLTNEELKNVSSIMIEVNKRIYL